MVQVQVLAGNIVLCMFLGKTLYSHSASLHLAVKKDTGKLNAGGNPEMDSHPIQAEVEILLITSCYRIQDKLWPDGPLGLYRDLTCYLYMSMNNSKMVK